MSAQSATLSATEAYASKILSHVRSRSYHAPELPRAAVRVVELAIDPNSELSQVADTIEGDPALGARVLTLANSAVYRGRHEVTDVRQAVMRLGMRTLRDIVLQASLESGLFKARHYRDVVRSLRRHSLATAHVARKLDRANPWAFSAGLLHEVGIAGSLKLIADHSPPDQLPYVGNIWPSLELIHGEFGKLLCNTWGFPKIVGECVAQHHHDNPNDPSKLRALVGLADHIATACGFGIDVSDRYQRLHSPVARVDGEDLPLRHACMMLGVDAERYRNLLLQMSVELESLFAEELEGTMGRGTRPWPVLATLRR